MTTVPTLILLISLAIGLPGSAPRHLPATGSVPAVREKPIDLRCEYLRDPAGIGVPNPRLSWVTESAVRNWRQSAWSVLVASTPELLAKGRGDLWESGKVASDRSIQVEYAGKPLPSGITCWWKVCVWDNGGRRSEWSEPASWTMALLNPGDWKAAWIGPPVPEKAEAPAPLVRKEFNLDKAPERAIAHVNVLGYYELYINGNKVGEDVLSPAVSDLSLRSFSRTYDIGHYLHSGANCIGLWLDKGWYRKGAMGRVHIDLTMGGKPMVIGTDSTWTWAPGPSTPLGNWAWDGMGGERYDARAEIPGWCQPGCRQGDWKPVPVVGAPPGAVTAQSCPPNRIGEVIPLKSATALGPGLCVLDFGTNLSGWLSLKMPPMKAGSRVVMHYADKKFQTPEGDDTPAGKLKPTSAKTFTTSAGPVSYQTFNQADEFISAGKPGEQFCSRFNYHGFRYVIIEGLPAPPAPADAGALLVESDLETAGSFECSNELFNRIHRANLWTLRCLDLGGYMVDCPHRERLGYGDGQVGIESLVMNRDAAALYGKWAVDWLDAQNPSTGEMTHTAPNSGGGGGPGWGGAGCVLPWKLFIYYGDTRLLEKAYEPMKRYIGFLEGKCTAGVMRHYGGEWDFIGDWVAVGRGMDTNNWPGKDAAELFNNCYRLYLWEQLAKAADALGKREEAQNARQRIREIAPLVHSAYYDSGKKIYVINEQAYQLMPLMTGVVPETLRGEVMRKLEECILLKNRGHLDTGMLGTYFLIQYLQEAGRNDLLYTIFNQETYPGWGYMLAQGATTLWEQWNGYWSQIHSCFTSPGGWFYQGLAGILPDASAPGFKKFTIRPAIVGDLTWVKCSYHSAHGLIISNWKRTGNRLETEVTVPANTTATLWLPATDEKTVTESGKPASSADGVRFVGKGKGMARFELGSGNYRFGSDVR